MKNKNSKVTKLGGGYAAPTIEMMTILVEQGFAQSQKPDFGGEGEPGTDPSDPGYGDF